MSLTVYKSSAGSGKTFTLVLEYLRLVLRDPAFYRHVLAITFTNKAANEMKNRVLNALAALAADEPHQQTLQKMLQKILIEEGMKPEEIRSGAYTTFHSILHHYSDFNIGTIDAFSHRIIQTFSRDLHLPSLFEVEMETNILLRELVDELIAKVGTDDYVSRLLIGFLTDTLDDDGHWRIDRPLIALARMLLSEESFQELNEIQSIDEEAFNVIRISLNKKIQIFESQLADYAAAILSAIHDKGLTQNDIYLKSRGIYPQLEKLSNHKIEEVLNSKTFVNLLESENPFVSPKVISGEAGAFSSLSAQVLGAFNQMRCLIKEKSEAYRLLRLLRPNIYATALMSIVQQTLQEIIANKQQVPIFEFNKRIAALLQSSSVPYIYERLGDRFRSFLLDEFQDTSVLQWQNLLPLIENALAHGSRNLIVGDGKQSIYRFRGGEFQQFTDLPEIFGKEANPRLDDIERTLKLHYAEVKLDKNYRSLPEIVRFNNDFFAFLATKLEQFKGLYDDSQQKILPEKSGGYVQLNFFLVEDEPDVGAIRDRIKSKTIQTIQNLTSQGYAAGDIAVLVRSNKDGDEMANFLNTNGIEVVSADSLLLQSASTVNLIINTLKFIFDPKNIINCVELWMNLGDLQSEINLRGLEFSFDLNGQNNISELQANIEQILDIHTLDQSASLYDLVEELLRRYGFGHKADPYIQFLLQHIYSYQSGVNAGKFGFFEYWDQIRSKASVVVSENSSAVKVMTIHKAKGLEFPIVIYAFASMPNQASNSKFHWVDVNELNIGQLQKGLVRNRKDLENTRFASLYRLESEKNKLDTANLIYVAFTRAISQLYVMVVGSGRSMVFSYLKEFLERKNLWNKNVLEYSFGNLPDILPFANNKQVFSGQSSNELVSFGWSDRLRVAKLQTFQNSAEQQKALDRGNLMHLILSGIYYANQVEAVLKRFFLAGSISREEHNALEKLLNRMMQDENLLPLFAPSSIVKTESEIVDENGHLFRMDRFVELPDKVVIVDYKTGSPNDAHHQQLRQYAEILASLQLKKVEAILIYFKGIHDYCLVGC